MIVNYLKLRIRIFISTSLLLTLAFTGYSKENSNGKPAPAEPTDLEKNTALYGLSPGVTDSEYSPKGDPVSALVIGKHPLYENASRESLRASQQAAIWSACAEFAGWMKNVKASKLKKAPVPAKEEAVPSNPADFADKSELVVEELVSGLRVIHLHVEEDVAIAVLSWRAVPLKPAPGTLPQMKVRSESSSESTISDERREAAIKVTEKIDINGILVMESVYSSVNRDDSSSEAIAKHRQFFLNGKPNIEQTIKAIVKGGSLSQKTEGTIWDETGKKTQYRE